HHDHSQRCAQVAGALKVRSGGMVIAELEASAPDVAKFHGHESLIAILHCLDSDTLVRPDGRFISTKTKPDYSFHCSCPPRVLEIAILEKCVPRLAEEVPNVHRAHFDVHGSATVSEQSAVQGRTFRIACDRFCAVERSKSSGPPAAKRWPS